MISCARLRASASAASAFFAASASSVRPRSAAASPSAIVFCRSAMIRMKYGQTTPFTNQMKSRNQRTWPSSVALMFTAPSRGRSLRRGQPLSCDTSGFAYSSSTAIAVAIAVNASSRPATMNIFTCSVGIISGWGAEPSRKRPPRMPKPMAVPSAPMPMSSAAAICVLPKKIASSIFSPSATVRNLVRFARERHVDDGEHHEDERLQRDDQDVEDRPAEREQHVPGHRGDARRGVADGRRARHVPAPRASEQHDQDKQHLAGKHVAEQTQGERDRLGNLLDQPQREVHRREEDLEQQVVALERRGEDLVHEAAEPLEPQVEDDDQREHREGHG